MEASGDGPMIDVWRPARRWEPRHKSPRPDRRGRLSLRGFVGCTTLLTVLRGPQAEPRQKSLRPDRRGRLSLRGCVGCTTLLTATFSCTMQREQVAAFLRQCWFRPLTPVPDIYIVNYIV